MTKVDRRIRRLVDVLRTRSYVSIRELSQILGVSEMTVRRDIRRLEESNQVKNVNGTLVYSASAAEMDSHKRYNLLDEMDRQKLPKEKIGRYAAGLVQPGDLLIIDTGSTTGKIIPYLPIDRNLTVLCYNINTLIELYRNPGVNMMFAGGFYYPNTQMFASEQGAQFIRGIRAQKAFVSAAGVHRTLGITCANAYEVPTKQAVLDSSIEKILVADSSKFGAVMSAYFADLQQIDRIVTDAALSEEWREMILGSGIKLDLV